MEFERQDGNRIQLTMLATDQSAFTCFELRVIGRQAICEMSKGGRSIVYAEIKEDPNYAGYRIPPYYDSLIGKLIVSGKTRTECMMRLKRALGEFVIEGIETTIPLFQQLLAEPDIIDGRYDIHWLEHFLARQA